LKSWNRWRHYSIRSIFSILTRPFLISGEICCPILVLYMFKIRFEILLTFSFRLLIWPNTAFYSNNNGNLTICKRNGILYKTTVTRAHVFIHQISHDIATVIIMDMGSTHSGTPLRSVLQK
jgi:hypothetical protein